MRLYITKERTFREGQKHIHRPLHPGRFYVGNPIRISNLIRSPSVSTCPNSRRSRASGYCAPSGSVTPPGATDIRQIRISRGNMCVCTQYQSPTCSHQWLSLTQPCGMGMNLMTCPYRNTFQGLWAPGMCCPICNGTAIDPFVNQMVAGACYAGTVCPSTTQQCSIAGPQCAIAPLPCCELHSSCGCRRRKGKSHQHSFSYKESRGGGDCIVM